MRSSFLKPALLGAALAMAAVPARADIIVALASTPTATGDGYYSYTYNVTLTGGQLDPVSNGTPVQFGTVYDFGPLATKNGVSVGAPAPSTVYKATSGYMSNSFTFSYDLTDPAASTSNGTTSTTDNPNLVNIRFTYNGTTGIDVAGEPTTLGASTPTVPETIANLGTFTVYSPFGTTNPALAYDGQTFKGTNNTQQANIGQLSGPLVPVPEPASLALLGLGLVGTGLVRRRRG